MYTSIKKYCGISPGSIDVFASGVPKHPSLSKTNIQTTGFNSYADFLKIKCQQKVKNQGFLVIYTMPLLAIILKLLKWAGVVSSESKPNAFVEDGATFVFWVGSPLQENITFSPQGKMLVGFASLICIYTRQIA